MRIRLRQPQSGPALCSLIMCVRPYVSFDCAYCLAHVCIFVQGAVVTKTLVTKCKSTCAVTGSGGWARLGMNQASATDYRYGCLFSVSHVPCAPGTFCAGGVPAATCPLGYFCVGGTAAPTLCPAGTFGSATGLSSAACSGPCPCCDTGATAAASCTPSQTLSPSQTPSSSSTRSRTYSRSPTHTQTTSRTSTA